MTILKIDNVDYDVFESGQSATMVRKIIVAHRLSKVYGKRKIYQNKRVEYNPSGLEVQRIL